MTAVKRIVIRLRPSQKPSGDFLGYRYFDQILILKLFLYNGPNLLRELLRKVVDYVRYEKGGVPFRVGNANPGGSRVEGDATDVEGSREWGWKGSRRTAF